MTKAADIEKLLRNFIDKKTDDKPVMTVFDFAANKYDHSVTKDAMRKIMLNRIEQQQNLDQMREFLRDIEINGASAALLSARDKYPEDVYNKLKQAVAPDMALKTAVDLPQAAIPRKGLNVRARFE